MAVIIKTKISTRRKKSDIPGFYTLSPKQRLKIVRGFAGLGRKEAKALRRTGSLNISVANRMIENVIGTIEFPLGIATNFRVNKRDYLIPMAIEEPSVIAAASHAAKLCRPAGFEASSDEPIMIGQIQLVGIKNSRAAVKKIMSRKSEIKKEINGIDSTLIRLGGGLKNMDACAISTSRGSMVVVRILVDVRDAMGANAVNTMCEKIAPFLEQLTGGRPRLRIISNLAVYRMARARAVWKKSRIGKDAVEGILDAYELAKNDIFRCATHNKGIMNGIDAVAIATGNDFRALEAGAHSFACYGARYQPLTKFYKDKNGNLVGEIELPVAAATVGGATMTNHVAGVCLKILGVKSARELACVLASAGLAQNFAALRALSTEGIQKGHMKLHANNIAIMAGAGRLAGRVATRMVREQSINVSRAAELIKYFKKVGKRKKK